MRKHFLLVLMTTLSSFSAWADDLVVEFGGKEYTAGENPTVVYAGDETAEKATIALYSKSESGEKTPINATYYGITYQLNDAPASQVRNVGSYTATITGYNAAVGGISETVTFEVTKKEVKKLLDLKSVQKTYGESDATVLEALVAEDKSILEEGDKFDDFLSCLTVVRSDEDKGGENAGPHKVLVVGNSDAVSNYKYVAPDEGKYATMTIEPRPLTLTFTRNREYNGSTVSLGNLTSDWYSLETVLQEDEQKVTVESFSLVGDAPMLNAGPYDLKVKLGGDAANNYVVRTEGKDDNVVVFTIKKVDVEIVAKDGGAGLEKVYDGKTIDVDLTDKFDFNTFVNNETATSLKIAMKVENAVKDFKEGGYPIYVYVDGKKVEDLEKELTNYNLSYERAVYTINKKDINEVLTADKITVDPTYQGVDFDIAKEGVLKVEGLLPADYKATKDKEAINADDKFTLTITGDGNYSGKVTKEITITKAPLTIVLADAEKRSKVYGDEDPDLMEAGLYTFEGFVNKEKAEKYGLSFVREEGEDVGFYIVRPALNGITFSATAYADKVPNYEIKEYEPALKTNKFEITKAKLTYWIAGGKLTYNGYDQKPEYEVAMSGNVEGETADKVFTVAPEVAIKNGTAATKVGKYELSITNENAVESKNYELTYNSENNTVFEIIKAKLIIDILDQELNFDENEEPNLDIQIAYNKDSQGGKTVHIYDTFRTADKTAINKLLENHTLELAKNADYRKVGYQEGAIKLDVDELELDNFEVEIRPGDLDVTANMEIVLDVTAEDAEDSKSVKTILEAYNKRTVEKVTIKNLKNVTYGSTMKKGLWYSLVLPFEIRVRDLSRVLDYAIVNIPDVSKNIEGEAYFKLTMDKVPANTLMLVKIDEDKKWADGAVLEFGKENGIEIKIDYDPEPKEGQSIDGAGNKFMPVYSKATISKDNEWIVYYETGVFHNPKEMRQNSMFVYPLNGYIDVNVKEAEAHNIRIFVEDVDGTVTAINTIENGVESNSDADGWYTINGVKLNAEPTEKGIYINNGKKVVIK